MIHKIFSKIENLSKFSVCCIQYTSALSVCILLALLILWFAVPHTAAFLYLARYGILTAAAIFGEAIVFALSVNGNLKPQK